MEVQKHDKHDWEELAERAESQDAKAVIGALMLLSKNLEVVIDRVTHAIESASDHPAD